MPELLLELLSEEIPARMQDGAREALAGLVQGIVADAGLPPPAIRTFATPRRLTLVATELAEQQASRVVERRGPRVDAPEAAQQGFRKTLSGLAYELVERDEGKKGRVLYALVREAGRPTIAILAEKLPEALARFPWQKSMRWGDGEARWVRPLQSILCLFGGDVVPFHFAGIESSNSTYGHRFMAPAPLGVSDFQDYRRKLLAAKVMLDGSERKRLIREGAEALAREAGLVLEPDEALLDEVKGLVEWPVPLLGRIDEAFMDIPSEVLVLTMRQNQKYLALRYTDGRLAPRFVVVANIEADDGGKAIVAGNERVLRARLWDARFFWEQDKQRPLEELLPKLDNVVFHADLGTMGERVRRLVMLASELVPFVPGANRALAERAALLAKADLVTGMVGEFPELQGIMGSYYARIPGRQEPIAVARAIAEHYSPKGPEDICPTDSVSVVLALADKLDLLAGFFSIGIKPTGSKDPFGLRRATLGVIRLILERELRLNLFYVLSSAAAKYESSQGITGAQLAMKDTMTYFADRLKVYLRTKGTRHDLIAAVYALGNQADLVQLVKRAMALQQFLNTDDGKNLLAGYKRASNIVLIEQKKDGREYTGEPRADLLQAPEERRLYQALTAETDIIQDSLRTEDFTRAMATLASLRPPIDAFLDHVMVNTDPPELRVNRLLILSRVRSALGTVADFSLIEDTGRPA